MGAWWNWGARRGRCGGQSKLITSKVNRGAGPQQPPGSHVMLCQAAHQVMAEDWPLDEAGVEADRGRRCKCWEHGERTVLGLTACHSFNLHPRREVLVKPSP